MKNIIYKSLHRIIRIYWFIFRPKTYGVKCVIQNGEDVLLIRNTYGYKSWTFPGGKVEKNETPEEATKREIMEEVGIKLVDLKYCGQFLSTTEYKRDTIEIFSAEVKNKNLKVDSKEISEATWFSFKDLPPLPKNAVMVVKVFLSSEPDKVA
jgi:mutator protein MutT